MAYVLNKTCKLVSFLAAIQDVLYLDLYSKLQHASVMKGNLSHCAIAVFCLCIKCSQINKYLLILGFLSASGRLSSKKCSIWLILLCFHRLPRLWRIMRGWSPAGSAARQHVTTAPWSGPCARRRAAGMTSVPSVWEPSMAPPPAAQVSWVAPSPGPRTLQKHTCPAASRARGTFADSEQPKTQSHSQ